MQTLSRHNEWRFARRTPAGFDSTGTAVMNSDANFKFAGPIEIDQAVLLRDSLIREDNDGKRIDDNRVREYVEKHKEKIFGSQSTFFAELREKESQIKV
jgi:hypothetical protein